MQRIRELRDSPLPLPRQVRLKKDLSLHKPSFDPQFRCQFRPDPLADTAVDEPGVAKEEVKAEAGSPNFCSSSFRSSSCSSSPSPPQPGTPSITTAWTMDAFIFPTNYDVVRRLRGMGDAAETGDRWPSLGRPYVSILRLVATEMEEEHHFASRYLVESADLGGHWIECGPKAAKMWTSSFFSPLTMTTSTRALFDLCAFGHPTKAPSCAASSSFSVRRLRWTCCQHTYVHFHEGRRPQEHRIPPAWMDTFAYTVAEIADMHSRGMLAFQRPQGIRYLPCYEL